MKAVGLSMSLRLRLPAIRSAKRKLVWAEEKVLSPLGECVKTRKTNMVVKSFRERGRENVFDLSGWMA